MWTLLTEIDIEASPDQVWKVLTDFDAYPTWNSFIPWIRGRLAVGEQLVARIEAPGGPRKTFDPLVLAVEPDHELRWLGKVWIRGIFDGEHRFAIEPQATGGVRFLHQERVNGILAGPFARVFETQTRNGFEAMNRGVKQQAEALARSGGRSS